jgi:endonuclease YncB( thermonuclease family)
MFLNKKKAILVISICLIFYPLTYNDVKSQEINIITGTAIVADGDSIKINNKRIRLVGIDAPEINQKCKHKIWNEYPCGKNSKEFLEALVESSQITCFYSDKDRYKRILGVCYIGDENSVAVKNKFKGLELNSFMVRLGQAVAYIKYSNEYIDDEKYAIENRHGIWDGEFEMPWDYRKNN